MRRFIEIDVDESTRIENVRVLINPDPLSDAGTEVPARLSDAADATLCPTWLPTVDAINALPEPLRQYIHDLEANADPAGMVAENTLLRDQTRQLDAMTARLKARVEHYENVLRLAPGELAHALNDGGFRLAGSKESVAHFQAFYDRAIAAEQQLAQLAAAEPVAWQFRHNDLPGRSWSKWFSCSRKDAENPEESVSGAVKFEYRALYAAPPQHAARVPEDVLSALKRAAYEMAESPAQTQSFIAARVRVVNAIKKYDPSHYGLAAPTPPAQEGGS